MVTSVDYRWRITGNIRKRRGEEEEEEKTHINRFLEINELLILFHN